MMTVNYECEVVLSEYEHLTQDDLEALDNALRYYDCYLDGDKLTISGECEVDDYTTTAADVAADIKWLLWQSASVDADVKATCDDDDY